MQRAMRRSILTLHLIVALVASAFVVVLGATGAIMAFEPELDHLLYRQLCYVTPQPTLRSLVELGVAAAQSQGGDRVSGYLLSTTPNLAYQVLFRGRAVYVDQYSGRVIGVRGSGPDYLTGRFNRTEVES